ncbi:MAG: T9SS type A sorting domain-containing protein [Bacteroidetes bacterium]|nr:T9SS type A sorting domain-containing protein [Bacteroidota bacterium]
MKKITLFMGLVLASTMSFSQVIVSLTSVPCNTGLEGNYPYEYAGELDGSATDWNEPNIFLGANSVSGCLEFINDGTPGMVTGIGVPPLQNVPMAYLGCDTAGNATQDLTGKIAVIYRGTCEFGYKAYNAQKRGAIAVIIINHTGDAVDMGGGTYGPQVNIPVIQIGRVAGDDLRLAIESCGACTVTCFIGSKVGLYANDMGSSIADIVMPNELAKPAFMAETGAEFPVDLGLWAFNYGTNAQTGVTASVNIDFGGSSVYSNTSAPLNFAAPAGIVIDTQYFDLGTFSPPTLSAGTYTVTYTLNIAGADDDATDNTFTYEYNLTGSAYAKSRTDAAGNPTASTAFSLNETSIQYDDFEVCMVFRDANASRYGKKALGMTFSSMPVGFDIDFEVLEVRLYEWNDVFTDMNDAALAFTALNQVASGIYFYDYASNGNLEGQNIYQEFDTPWPLTDNQRYLFCVYNASDSIRVGYDARIDYTATINNYLQPIAPVKDLPNGQPAEWFRDGFGWDVTPAISATIDYPTGVNANTVVKDVLAPYPNPTANLLTVPVRKGIVGNVTIEIYDLAGKLVIAENQTIGKEPLKVNVASIANGAYVFNLTFADGSKDTFKVSVNR